MSLKNTPVYPSLMALWMLAAVWGCRHDEHKMPLDEPETPELAEFELPLLWADMALYITQTTPANSPTFASRAFGYFGLTMYESVVKGYENKLSIAGQLNQILPLPEPSKGELYDWTFSLNAAQAYIIPGTG
jgi:hypothetical protein